MLMRARKCGVEDDVCGMRFVSVQFRIGDTLSISSTVKTHVDGQ
jgi:hypothetical protein